MQKNEELHIWQTAENQCVPGKICVTYCTEEHCYVDYDTNFKSRTRDDEIWGLGFVVFGYVTWHQHSATRMDNIQTCRT